MTKERGEALDRSQYLGYRFGYRHQFGSITLK
jgi:hypothetical protein